MHRLIVLVILLLQGFYTQAQSTMLESTRDRINFVGFNVGPNYGVFFGVEGPAGKVIGDGYLDTTFQAGNIRFYGRMRGSDSLMGVPVRLDLLANEVEVLAGPANVRAAKGPTVKMFAMNNPQGAVSRYINVREYRGDADAVNGFFERLVPQHLKTVASAPGQLELLVHPYIYIRKGNYNAALNVGTKDDELVKKTDWYVAQNGRASKFSPGKKAILELMADKQAAIESFLKTEKPDLKSRQGLIAVFAHYNSISL